MFKLLKINYKQKKNMLKTQKLTFWIKIVILIKKYLK